ncbi:MAG: MazG family protein [Micrococcales bacterium]|nr:MazG family protein [Micrococcales bacterium]
MSDHDAAPREDPQVPRGAALLQAVEVMDRLRSPGGCPWDAEQTHASLVKYLLEEAHEAADAIDSGDRADMAEELGDVLLQVLFQSRVAQDDPEPFDIDDVARGLVAKLVRRHPHVFADGDAQTPADVEQAWERIKSEEKAARAQASDVVPDTPAGMPPRLDEGLPASLPSLLRAEKVLSRLDRRDQGHLAPEGDLAAYPQIGEQLLALVARARAQGLSAERELRAALERLESDAVADTQGQDSE